MVAACRMVPSNAHNKDSLTCTEKIIMNDSGQLHNNNNNNDETENLEGETNILSIPISPPKMTKDLDFIEVTETGDKKEEEIQCVNKNENVTAVATPTRRGIKKDDARKKKKRRVLIFFFENETKLTIMVAACRMVPSNAHNKDSLTCTEKIIMNDSGQLHNNNNNNDETENLEGETNILSIPISPPKMTKDLDFIEVTETGDKKEEEIQCVNKNENVTAVATPTRRSQRNASKIKNATTSKDNNNNNVGTTNSHTTTSKTSQEQLPQIPPTPSTRRGPGRPRKTLVIEGLVNSQQQPPANLNHNNENRESVEASTLSNGSTLRIKFAKVGQVASSSSPFNVTNTPDSSSLNNNNNNSRGSGLPLSNTPSLINDTVVSSSSPAIIPPPVKRGPGRPRKNPLPPSTIPLQSSPSSYSVNNHDTSSSARQSEKKRKVSKNVKNDSYSNELGNKGNKKDHHNPRKKSKTGSNNEESSESSLRKTKLSGSIEPKKTPLDELRDVKIKEKEAELANVVDDHDSLIRELYYMESYNLLLNNLDPQTIKQDNSERMVKYLASHNLWSTLNEQVVNSIQLNSTRMSTRHSLTKHRELIVNMLQKSVGSRGLNLLENQFDFSPSELSSSSDNNVRNFRRTSKLESARNRESNFTGGIMSSSLSSSSSSSSSYSLRRRSHAQFTSLEDYLKSFVTLDEEDMTPVEEELRVEKAIELQYRIWALKNEGRLNEITKPAPEPSRPKIERDYLLELVTQRAKYMNKFTESKYRITRQIHKAVLQHFSKLANQGPREKKLEEKRIKRLAKTTANLVKQKWKSIESIILQKREELRKEEQTREGKRHLNLLLEHSTQMLEVQQNELLGAHLTRNQNKIMDTDNEYNNESNELEVEEEEEDDDDDDDSSSSNDQMSIDKSETSSLINDDGDYHEKEDEDEDEEDSDDDDDETHDLQVEKDLPIEDVMKNYADYLKSHENNNNNNNNNDDDDQHSNYNVDINLNSWFSDKQSRVYKRRSSRINENNKDDENKGDENKDDENKKDQEVENKEDQDNQDQNESNSKGKESESNSKENANEPNLKEKEKESNSNENEEESEIISAISEPPTGTTLSTANVRTQIPPLLRGQLREYQHVGLDWLASLYNNGINGILADEMGLGKTIQTIALLAHIAYEKGDWGPHLIVVPTSVIINWEMEFKKWCPGFIILTYYGNPKERKDKRIGWMKEHTFHVCITSYHLVVLDQVVFKKKKWHYLILDEAHNIKNFQSQRWKTLLNFNSERRLLLTGTPLQNNLMELWSLLYFLMPNGVSGDMPLGFANQKEFQEWFSRPVNKMIENNEQFDEETLSAVQKLHTVLRPYLLRRLKSDVEKQLPAKHHHIIKCRLSKRQRFLYDDFMSRAKTKETLQSGNFLSIINCLMQLRKVCNHPDLFELRPIRTSFAMSKSVLASYESSKHKVCRLISQGNNPLNQVNLEFLNLIPNQFEESLDWLTFNEWQELNPDCNFREKVKWYGMIENRNINNSIINYNSLSEFGLVMKLRSRLATKQRWEHMRYINSFRLKCRPIYGRRLINLCRRAGATICDYALFDAQNPRKYLDRTEAISDMIVSYENRYYMMEETIKQYAFVTPAVVARDMTHYTLVEIPDELRLMVHEKIQDIYHSIRVKLQIAFPDKRLLQYDCGKLQELDILLRRLKDNGHRALIFTQMTRVLDILEIFLNIHGHRYLRLDGATKVEQRQMLTERFNHDPKILVFILSTRSGGLGINLTGADSVIFYDSDWNPCMDRQCQDRCHRIGQTREVNIYRFVSEYTIEENMLQKANQKRLLDKMVITDGEFTTDFFQRMDWREIVSDIAPNRAEEVIDEPNSGIELEQCLAEVEDENDVNAAKVAKIEMDLDLTDFADTSETPAESIAARRASSISTVPSPRESNEITEITEANNDETTQDHEPERVIGHVDYYIARSLERELDINVGFGGIPEQENLSE
ncbi:hypothetical protein Glove_117g574 [Diversispora epigaea]|uniref:DNA helicase n=1 Tax=Diversispora epigaea TaxID=1348612 RepID=A0A397JAK7_9GLOM|nr:hypothetical protein Glove_117g574 [Diversispora epigaea]